MNDGSYPYLYPDLDVLENVPGLRDGGQLAEFEAVNTVARIYELLQKPVSGTFDAAHFKAMNKHIFQDVFAWAGHFRTTMPGKAESIRQPPNRFTPPHLLEHEAERIFRPLHRAKILCGLSRIEFALRAALLLADLNQLHPFREGNGRTQRLFVDAVAPAGGVRGAFRCDQPRADGARKH